jgi:hypothetical protein
MNPQPDVSIGNLFAAIFILMVLFYTYKSYMSGHVIDISNIDLVNIGYLQRDNIRVTNKIVTTPVSPPVFLSPPVNNFESQQLYVDCIDALHAMGMKKSEAKRKAKHIFSTTNPQPSNIQEFLLIAFRN